MSNLSFADKSLVTIVEGLAEKFDELIQRRPHTGRTTQMLASTAAYRNWASELEDTLRFSGAIVGKTRSELTKAQLAGLDTTAARQLFEKAEAASADLEAIYEREVRFL